MFSGLQKLFDKNFAVGFFLPALMATFLGAWIFDSWSLLAPLRDLAASDKKLTDLTYIALLIWVVAVLLVTSNTFQYRLLGDGAPH